MISREMEVRLRVDLVELLEDDECRLVRGQDGDYYSDRCPIHGSDCALVVHPDTASAHCGQWVEFDAIEYVMRRYGYDRKQAVAHLWDWLERRTPGGGGCLT